MKHLILYSYLLIGGFTFACGKSESPEAPSSNSGRRPDGNNGRGNGAAGGDTEDGDDQVQEERQPTITGDASSRVLDAPCTPGGSGPTVMEVDHFGSASDSFEVKTEWCLKGKKVGRLKLMFLVDHSGSMSRNDPLVSGSCGRLAAGQALIDKLRNNMKESDNIEVAAITFETRAKVASNFTSIDEFAKNSLKPEVFCGTVDQTNYEEAFRSAIQLVNDSGDEQTTVAAYLLSDGLPSLGTEKSPEDYLVTEQGALQAAKSFRENAKVSLHAVYLESAQIPGSTSPDVFLADLTGDSGRVRIVSNAQDLSATVTKFELPAPKTNLSSANATVTGKGKPRTISLKTVAQDPTNQNKILVTTERFDLTQADEEETDRYFIKLKIDVDDGTIEQTTIVINIKGT